MTITTNSSLDSAAQRRADELNAARPLDNNGQPIGPAVTAESVLTDNANAILQSWKDAQAADDLAKLRDIGAAFLNASPDVQAQISKLLS